MMRFLTLVLLTLTSPSPVSSNPAQLRNRIAHNQAPNATASIPVLFQWIKRRQVTSIVSTCGYHNGDPKSSRTAEPGFGCRVDTSNGIWGFCPTSVVAATDCGLAGYCVDRHSCKNGCGRLSSRDEITTITCESKNFCSTVLLINGPDQSFEYIACGSRFAVDSLLAVPNAIEATTTTPSSTSSEEAASKQTQSFTPFAFVSSSANTSPTLSSAITPLATSSSTTTSAPTSPDSKQTNIGAIVGGTIAGIVVICATILGVFIIRQKRGGEQYPPAPLPSSYNHNDFASTLEVRGHDGPEYLPKDSPWDSSNGPVEVIVRGGGNMSPVELPGSNVRWETGRQEMDVRP